jgi:carboxymethylenebutenolidase
MGDPKLDYDIAQAMPYMQKLNGEEILADVDTALRYLESEGFPAEKVGVVGFCMGGTVALVVGARRPVGAAVTFYGGGVAEGRFGFPPLVEEAPNLQAPWLGLFGDRDAHIPVDDVERLRQAAATASVPTELIRYADADHGFHCDARGSYHPESAKDAWQRTLTWFDQHVAGRKRA